MALEPLNIDLTLIAQQSEFVQSEALYPAYFGGYDNGKTFSLCARAIKHSLAYPNNRGLIARASFKDLCQTTRQQFFEIFGCNESTIGGHPLVQRFVGGGEHMLRFINGSEIYFRHVDDEGALSSLKSMNLRWFAIDQAEEVPESAFWMLVGRIGRTPGPPVWGALSGNPAGHNWIWQRWKKNALEGCLDRDYHLVEATTFDNPFRDPGYIDRILKTYPSHWIQRYIYGNWDVFKGQVYDEYDSNIHIIQPFAIPDAWKMGLGMDLGWNHPTAVVWCAVDYDGNWYIYDEHRCRELLPKQHVEAMRGVGLVTDDGRQLPIYAPHDAQNIAGASGLNYQQAYADAGVLLSVGNRLPVIVRILKCKEMLRVRPDVIHPFTGRLGAPRCYIFSSCEQFREEIGGYRWKDLRAGEETRVAQPDEVVKVNDDLMDAWGYWAMGWSARSVPVRPEPKTAEMYNIESLLGDLIAVETDWRML